MPREVALIKDLRQQVKFFLFLGALWNITTVSIKDQKPCRSWNYEDSLTNLLPYCPLNIEGTYGKTKSPLSFSLRGRKTFSEEVGIRARQRLYVLVKGTYLTHFNFLLLCRFVLTLTSPGHK